MNYVTVDTVLAKLFRDLRDTPLHESDVIEWIGEALEFLKVPQVQEEAVHFTKVTNHEADIPKGFHLAIQLARNNNWSEDCNCATAEEVAEALSEESPSPVLLDCHGTPLQEYEYAYYRPYYDLQWEYSPWTASGYYRNNYSPIRLANNTFFNSLVCKELSTDIYNSCVDEYTIVGTTDRKFRFSFEEGFVAISYLRNAIDPETGYPLVPDQVSFLTAIGYYVQWKIAEWWSWNGREGAGSLAQDRERKWLKYVKQAKNYAKMPKTVDEYQNMMEDSLYLIPRTKRYYGFFGKLGRPENRAFSDPDYRNRFIVT